MTSIDRERILAALDYKASQYEEQAAIRRHSPDVRAAYSIEAKACRELATRIVNELEIDD